MAENENKSNPTGSGQEPKGRAARAASWLEGVLGRKVGSDDGKISWGLIVLLVVAVYAVYQIIHAFLFFFK